jgi:hypothetical protein
MIRMELTAKKDSPLLAAARLAAIFVDGAAMMADHLMRKLQVGNDDIRVEITMRYRLNGVVHQQNIRCGDLDDQALPSLTGTEKHNLTAESLLGGKAGAATSISPAFTTP